MFDWWKMRAILNSLNAADENIDGPSVEAVTDDGFEYQVVERPGATSVFSCAAWRKHCRTISEAVQAIASGLTDILSVKLGVEEAAKAALRYNVSSAPTFLLLADRKLRASRFGSATTTNLKEWIRESNNQIRRMNAAVNPLTPCKSI